MSLKIGGLSREQIEQTWRATKPRSHEATKTRSEPRASASGPAGRSADAEIHPIGDLPVSRDARPAIFDRDSILAFAAGNPSDAFGEPYRVFDRDRRIARLPRPPYMVLDRITEIHAEAWRLEPGGWIEAQYDVPPDAWYFRANRQPAIPFAVLLEVGLQPCGWLAAFLGSALRSEEDLRFRNLGGRATLHREVFADAGTLTTRVRITDVSEAGGMIVEKFDLQIWQGPRLVYASDTYFGFFSDAALANQVGVRGAAERTWSPGADVRQATSPLSPIPPLTPDDAGYKAGDAACLPAGALSMIDAIDAWLPDGGPHGLGFIRGVKRVDPREWFFDAHFYQDPVCPGSLGLESFQQLLKFVALDRWGNASATGGRRYGETHRFEPMTVGATHEWVYRGQVVPTNKRVEVEAVVTSIDDGPQPAIGANGFLKVDGLYIYEMIDFGIRLVPDSRRV